MLCPGWAAEKRGAVGVREGFREEQRREKEREERKGGQGCFVITSACLPSTGWGSGRTSAL